jgi:hypothetical protein
VQVEIDGLRARLTDLREPWQAILEESRDRMKAFTFASATLAQDGAYRQKSEALSRVVERIVCYFRYTDKSGKPTAKKSFLDYVKFIPADPSGYLPVEIKPGPC